MRFNRVHIPPPHPPEGWPCYFWGHLPLAGGGAGGDIGHGGGHRPPPPLGVGGGAGAGDVGRPPSLQGAGGGGRDIPHTGGAGPPPPPGAVSHAPSSGFVRQPLGRASQISQQGSGDLLCMGGVNRVYTVQRQPPIYPTRHGSHSGTHGPGMVGEGTLIYLAGGPAGGPPEKPGSVTAVAFCLLPE